MAPDDIPVVSNPLFFIDYDGTLAPIVSDPMEAVPHPEASSVLRRLSERYPLWIVTGRFLKDLTHFIDEPYDAIGLHGMQEGRLGEDVRELIPDEVRTALRRMRSHVPQVEGLKVESKGPSFAVHYRHARDENEAVEALEAWIEGLPEMLDVIRGKKVYEIRPRDVSKGTAVTRITLNYPERTPIYLGDDVTDEDAFEALDREGYRAVTVKVGPGKSRAKYRLDGPDDVVQYLERYLID